MTTQTEADLKPIHEAQLPRELSATETDIAIDPNALRFQTTRDLEPLDEIIGQEKALSALQLGLGIPQEGYNIFVAGMTGPARMERIRKSLEKRLDGSAVPNDWVYVNNFEDPDEPWAIALKPGQGRELKKSMEKLIERLQEALPKAFRQEDFSEEKERLGEKYEQVFQEHMNQLKEKARQRGFDVNASPEGQVFFIPLIDGRQIESEEQLENLSEKEKIRIREGRRDLLKESAQIMQKQRDMVQNLTDEIREVERRFGSYVITPLINQIKEKFPEPPRIHEYLDKVAEDMLDNLSRFRHRGGPSRQSPMLQMLGGGEAGEPEFLEYQVNVLVDHSHSKGAPIIVEEAPTYTNLFGSIERTVERGGRIVTNFTQIKAGSLLRASGGYLIFNIEDALTEPLVYKNLKRTLKCGKIMVENYNPWYIFSTGGLRPEPIPIRTKVVVLGSQIINFLLRMYDEEFSTIFKIKADFGEETDRDERRQEQFARTIAGICRADGLRPFSADAVAEVIRYGARQVYKKDKLLTHVEEISDILRESNYFAGICEAEIVEGRHVLQALENRVYRSNRIAEKIRELIADGAFLVALEGKKIGQINGLAILNLGDYMFGKPNRITTSVALGSEGVINIEREARLSGRTHDKGVLILSGYLRNTYGRNKALTLSASITLEQSYGGIEGDSASAAELFALLSNLAQEPLRQDIAVTGSINQWGEIQAIGGVNEKIEGFYDVCSVVGLTGRQGVCIPESNIQNLILRRDVREDIARGRFHIYPIRTVDEGLELLSEKKAGSPSEEGTLHWKIDRQLQKMAHDFRKYPYGRLERLAPPPQEAPPMPIPPKTPDDQPKETFNGPEGCTFPAKKRIGEG